MRRRIAPLVRPLRGWITVDVLFRRDISREVPDFEADVPIEINVASRREFEGEVVYLQPPHDDRYRKLLLTQFDQGIVFFVARSGSKLVGYDSILLKPALVQGSFFALGPGEVYGVYAFVAYAWRGKRIHPALLSRMLQYAHERGYTTAYTHTRISKRAARKTLHRLGFEVAGRLLRVRVRGRLLRFALTGSAHPLGHDARAASRPAR